MREYQANRQGCGQVLAGLILAIGLATAPTPTLAHNGSIAIVAPTTTAIDVDGDLTDWSPTARWYPLDVPGVGTRPSSHDFQGRFTLAFDRAAGLLYIAIDIDDDSIVTESLPGLEHQWWEASDGCEIYLDVVHTDSSAGRQYSLYGTRPSTSFPVGGTAEGLRGVRYGVRRNSAGHVYEWAIDLAHAVGAVGGWREGTSIALDVVGVDRDADGSLSWMAWGDGILKAQRPGSRGDVLLIGEQSPVGRIEGRLIWHAQARGVRNRLLQFSGPSSGLQVTTRSGGDGHFELDLPAGHYVVVSSPDTLARDLLVVTGEVSQPTWSILPSHPKTTVPPVPRQVEAVGTRNGLWHNYGPSDGLAGNMVRAFAETDDGDIWVATSDGISRFDGRSFHSLGHRQDPLFDDVMAIAAHHDGLIWVGTQFSGAVRLDSDSLTVFTTKDGLGADQVMDILIDGQGDVWMATLGGGLSRFDGEQFETFTTRDGLASNTLIGLAQDHEGRIWCALQSGGVSRLDPSRLDEAEASVIGAASPFTNFTMAQGLTHEAVNAIAVDEDGCVWVGGKGGIDVFDGERFVNVVPTAEVGDADIFDLQFDHYGQLWAATPNAGVYRFAFEKTVRTYRTVHRVVLGLESGLVTDAFISLLVDRQGNLWAGAFESGVFVFTGNAFHSYDAESGLPGGVWAQLETDTGEVWVATAGGIFACTNHECQSVELPEEIAGWPVYDLLQDRQGRIWFATKGAGLGVMDGAQIQIFTTRDGLVSNEVSRLLEDRDGDIWAATDSGLMRYDGRTWSRIGEEWEQLRGRPKVLLEDHEGNIWVAVLALNTKRQGRGVMRFDGESWELFDEDDGLDYGAVRAMGEDRRGRLWFGTDRGLTRLDGQIWRSFNREDGLGEGVTSIAEDDEGVLWLGTMAGVYRFDGQVFQPLLRSDGLASDAIYEILQDRKGVYWIGGGSGLTRYEPVVAPPPVHIRAVVAGERYDEVDHVRMPSTADHVGIEFDSPSVKTRNAGMAYRYRLGGVDSTWQITRQPAVEYFDLPLGSYLFEVEAIDRDLGVSDPPAQLRIEVHPPYLQILTSVTIGLLMLAGGLALGTVWHRRRQRLFVAEARSRDLQELNEALQAADALKSDFVSNVSHELRTPLTVIKSSVDNMLDGITGPFNEMQSTYMDRLNINADRLVRLIDDLLDLSRIEAGYLHLRPQALKVDAFIGSTIDSMRPLAAMKEIDLSSECEEGVDGWADPDRLHQILVNLISNAVKFTPNGGRVTVGTSATRGNVLIYVRDTGPGIPQAERERIFERFHRVGQPSKGVRGTGIGLAISRRLVELHGGSIWVEDSEEGGSEFYFTLPNEKGNSDPGEQAKSDSRE